MTLSTRRLPWPNESWCPDPPTEPGYYERRPYLADTYTERVLVHVAAPEIEWAKPGELLVTTLLSPAYAQTHVNTPLRWFHTKGGGLGGGWRVFNRDQA